MNEQNTNASNAEELRSDLTHWVTDWVLACFDQRTKHCDEHFQKWFTDLLERQPKAAQQKYNSLTDSERIAKTRLLREYYRLYVDKSFLDRFLEATEYIPEVKALLNRLSKSARTVGVELLISDGEAEGKLTDWRIWELSIAEAAEAHEIANSITEELLYWIEHLTTIHWIAFIPMERRFAAFPDVTDFGIFQIVNPANEAGMSARDVIRRFENILETDCGVIFHPSDEIEQSPYRVECEDIYHRTSGYIPGRPLLMIGLGRGERQANTERLRARTRAALSYIRLCQIEYDLRVPESTTNIRSATCTPNGEPMTIGYTHVPPLALVLNRLSGGNANVTDLTQPEGAISWYDFSKLFGGVLKDESEDVADPVQWVVTPRDLSMEVFETSNGSLYDVNIFLEIWNETIVPVLRLNERVKERNCVAGLRQWVETMNNAIDLVGRCRHEPGNLLVNAVVATESLLNPGDHTHGLTERFALRAAMFGTRNDEIRSEVHKQAKDLYRLRSKAVHSKSDSRREGDYLRNAKDAFRLFLACLRGVGGWLEERDRQYLDVKQEAFDAHCLDRLLSMS